MRIGLAPEAPDDEADERVAAAAALRRLGSSSATVCTPSANVGAVATYQSAGFGRLPDVRDLRRPEASASSSRTRGITWVP